MRITKRSIDIILAFFGMAVLTPLIPIIGLLIKMDTKGPVFYLSDRIGKDMVKFKMYKFRTMVDFPVEVGQSVSAQHDPRVTFFGRFLRRSKLNELPQLINVLMGQMTFVGPRPEAPDLAERYPESAKEVFSVKPGLVGPATILGRNEEECYPPGVDATQYYIEHILPGKLELDLKYIRNASIMMDLYYICLGIKETLSGSVSKKYLQNNGSQLYLLLIDILLSIISYMVIRLRYYGSYYDETNIVGSILFLTLIISVRVGCYVFFGLYSSLIRYISYHDIKGVFLSCTISSLILVVIAQVIGYQQYPASVGIIDLVVLTLMLSGVRFGLWFYWEKKRSGDKGPIRRRVLIYGADDLGYKASRALVSSDFSPYEVIGFIDDHPEKLGKVVNGVKVLGNRYHIKEIANLYRVEGIIVNGNNLIPRNLIEIVRVCQESNDRCQMLPFIISKNFNSTTSLSIRKMELSDILPLKLIHTDYEEVKKAVSAKTILLNGSGGALGIELSRKLLLYGCKKLIIVDRYEAYLNESVAAITKYVRQDSIIPILIETNDKRSIEHVFRKYRPDIVIQAAMRKYESFLKINHRKINRTNYDLTMNLALLTAKYRSETFILISSSAEGNDGSGDIHDSVRNVEDSLIQYYSQKTTRLVISRLCNIAENRGGVVSLLEDQIVNHGRVLLPTDKTKCVLMTKYSATDFILQNLSAAGKDPKKNIVHTSDAGSSITLIELAQRIAAYHGIDPMSDLEITFMDQSDRIHNLAAHAI